MVCSLDGFQTEVEPSMIWRRSLSVVTTTVRSPFSAARTASEAMASSASYLGNSAVAMRRAWSSSFSLGTWTDEVVRHGFAVGLIVAVLLVADRRPLDVEDDTEVIGLVLVEELAQRGDEAEDGAGREAGGIGQVPDGVIGAVEEGVPVDEEEAQRAQSYLPSGICPRIVLCCSSIIRAIRSPASGRPRKAV